MPVEFDFSILKDIGIGGLGAFALYLFYKIFIFFIERWKESTDAINRNTDTHENLNQVFQIFYAENKQFQDKALDLMNDTNKKVHGIDRKVKDIHERMDRNE